MLASQTQDGDLKVWSVAKAHNANDPAKVVRVLRRNEVNKSGPNWMGWSKNGRIIQYTDSYVHLARFIRMPWDKANTRPVRRYRGTFGRSMLQMT